jgi:GTPase
MSQKCGYVAFHGRPNAGKSTLFNAIVGAKLASVSCKPQTTRNRLLGNYTAENTQLLILDTPGMHNTSGKPKLNASMNSVAWNAVNDADVVCYLVDASVGWHKEDSNYLSGILNKTDKPVILLATKIDSMKLDVISPNVRMIHREFQDVVSQIPGAAERFLGPTPHQVSAKRPESVAELRDQLLELMPEGPWLYPADDLSDVPQRTLFAELIREQLFRQLDQELPYSCGVRIDTVVEGNGTLLRIQATIVVAKESHKGIVIGQGGSRLKAIGTAARLELERQNDQKVYLELHVAVEENWTNDLRAIQEFEGILAN